MGAISDDANLVYRDYNIPGDPASGDHVPVKSEIRGLFSVIDGALGSLGVNGAITVKAATEALLDADLNHGPDTLGIVYNDPTSAKNGIYAKSGASGSGSWDLTDLALPASFADDLASVSSQLEVLDAAVAAAEAAEAAAGASATAAAGSASAAATSATMAATASTDASAAQSAAEDFRDEAGASATAAAASATSAGTAKTGAEAAEAAAATSATAAETSATAAGISAAASVGSATSAASARMETEAARAAAETFELAAASAKADAESARDQALTYAELSGPFLFYETKAEADAAVASLPDGQQVQVWLDETRGDARVAYVVASGALDFLVEFPTQESIEAAFAQPRTFSLYGETTTRDIDTNLAGNPVPADIGQIFIGNAIPSADAITIDSGANFPPGIATRRYLGTASSPTVVTGGTQLGYIDFRGYSGTQFWNSASIDAIVDTGISFTNGNLPPTKIRFATASGNAGAKVRMEILASGRVEIGAVENNLYYGPPSLNPRFYVTTLANEWGMVVYAQPLSGAGYAARFHTLGQTASDYLFGGSSGAGTGSFKFSVRGNGDVYSSSGYYVGTNKLIGARGAAIADLAVTVTTGTLPAPTGSLTIADGASPTNAELLRYCVELEAKLETLLARLRPTTGHGLIS